MHKIIKIQAGFSSLGKLHVMHFRGRVSIEQHSLAGLTSISARGYQVQPVLTSPNDLLFHPHSQALFPLQHTSFLVLHFNQRYYILKVLIFLSESFSAIQHDGVNAEDHLTATGKGLI